MPCGHHSKWVLSTQYIPVALPVHPAPEVPDEAADDPDPELEPDPEPDPELELDESEAAEAATPLLDPPPP